VANRTARITRTVVAFLLVALVFAGRARGQQTPPPTVPPTTPAAPTASAPARAAQTDDPRWPLFMAGWMFDSVLRNAATGSVILSRRQGTRDWALWRGVQASGAFGARGFQVGLGYGRMRIEQIPIGYEFRALGGRVRKDSRGLTADEWFAGGEATVMFAFLRLSGGVVVPTGSGASRKPLLTGSFGISFFFSRTPPRQK
jgi:hypothetical protein